MNFKTVLEVFILFIIHVNAESDVDNIITDKSNDGVNETENGVITDDVTVSDIADILLKMLRVDSNDYKIKILTEKLNKINNYTIDKDKYAQLILSETTDSSLNETNFYNALQENDHFQYLVTNEPKNLYLKLKEKMNRDDILKVLTERGQNDKWIESARKVMSDDLFGHVGNDEFVDVIVDRMIAETPRDEHKYDETNSSNIYWDPQRELEDLKEFHQHDGRRLFKGERTTIRYYPFMVSVHVMGRFWCGGVIYWHDIVLTSASCLQLMHNNRFFRENPRVLQVRVGSNHSRIGGEIIDALEVYFHPAYSPRTLQNNIAVIRLRRHLFFNYHRLPKVIDISHNAGGLPSTAEVLLLGWGVTKLSQRLAYEPIFLQRKFLPVYPNVFCKEVYGEKFITQTMFCAGTLTTGEGACDHDAGGPAILAGKLVGIISFGPTVCGYHDAPTVFTLVGAYADWIETINETMPGYYRANLRTTTTTERSAADFFQEKIFHHATKIVKPIVTGPAHTTDSRR